MKTEPFSPLLQSYHFNNFEDVIKRANNNDLDVLSYIYTNNLEKAHQSFQLMK